MTIHSHYISTLRGEKCIWCALSFVPYPIWYLWRILGGRGVWPIRQPTTRGKYMCFWFTFKKLSCCPSLYTVKGLYRSLVCWGACWLIWKWHAGLRPRFDTNCHILVSRRRKENLEPIILWCASRILIPPNSTHCIPPRSPPIGAVLDGLGVDLTAAYVFDTQQQLFSISDLSLSHGLQVGLLHLGVASPHDLPTEVHGHGWFLPTQLRQSGRWERREKCKV